jgi:hypothetical protein
MGDRKSECDRHGGVHGVASALQDLESGTGRIFFDGRHHAE